MHTNMPYCCIFIVIFADISADMAFYRQIKYLSADIWNICRYADMEKFSRYFSADIWAGISADSIGRLDYRSYSSFFARALIRMIATGD